MAFASKTGASSLTWNAAERSKNGDRGDLAAVLAAADTQRHCPRSRMAQVGLVHRPALAGSVADLAAVAASEEEEVEDLGAASAIEEVAVVEEAFVEDMEVVVTAVALEEEEVVLAINPMASAQVVLPKVRQLALVVQEKVVMEVAEEDVLKIAMVVEVAEAAGEEATEDVGIKIVTEKAAMVEAEGGMKTENGRTKVEEATTIREANEGIDDRRTRQFVWFTSLSSDRYPLLLYSTACAWVRRFRTHQHINQNFEDSIYSTASSSVWRSFHALASKDW